MIPVIPNVGAITWRAKYRAIINQKSFIYNRGNENSRIHSYLSELRKPLHYQVITGLDQSALIVIFSFRLLDWVWPLDFASQVPL